LFFICYHRKIIIKFTLFYPARYEKGQDSALSLSYHVYLYYNII